MKKNNQYEVRWPGDLPGGKEYVRVSNAKEVKDGWLHYELKDGTNGLARPGTWRHLVKK